MKYHDDHPRPSFDLGDRPGCLIALTVAIDIIVVLLILM